MKKFSDYANEPKKEENKPKNGGQRIEDNESAFDLLKRRIITLLRKDLKENEVERVDDFDEYPSYIVENDINLILESYDYKFTEMEKIAYERLLLNNEKIENVAKELGLNSKSLSNAKQRVIKKIKKEVNK